MSGSLPDRQAFPPRCVVPTSKSVKPTVRNRQEVPQGGSLVAHPGDAVTRGLGPCIGVAFVSEGLSFLLHVWSAHAHETAAEFFAKIAVQVPQHMRSAITPTVCGGSLDTGRVEGTRSRTWVLKNLKSLGFASPVINWCSPGSAQDLEIVSGRIRVAERRVVTVGVSKKTVPKKKKRSRNNSKIRKLRPLRGTSAE